MLKYSRQREKIENYLKNTKEHPTAEHIFTELRKEIPDISLATVYRNLNLLCSQGLAQRISFGEAEDRYDADVSSHGHFICNSCGRVLDFYGDAVNLSVVLEEIGNDSEVYNHKLFVYGQCSKCKNK